MPKYEGECIEEVELCYGTDDYSLYNDTMQRQCRDQACYTCKDVSTIRCCRYCRSCRYCRNRSDRSPCILPIDKVISLFPTDLSP